MRLSLSAFGCYHEFPQVMVAPELRLFPKAGGGLATLSV